MDTILSGQVGEEVIGKSSDARDHAIRVLGITRPPSGYVVIGATLLP